MQRYGTLAVLLGFAATAQFCFLNPQPEPPADRGTSCPACTTGGSTGGSGGATTTGGGGAGGGPINPGNPDGGIIIVSDAAFDARTGSDAASADAQPDAGTDGGGDDDGSDDSDAGTDGAPDDAADDAPHDGGAPDDVVGHDGRDGPLTEVDVLVRDVTDGAVSR